MDEDEIIALLEKLPVKGGERTWRCLAEAELAAYADNRLEGRARERVEGHIADCRFCLEQIGFLVRLQEGEAPEVPHSLQTWALALGGRASFRRAYRWGAIAAAMAGLTVFVMLRPRPPEAPAAFSPPIAVPRAEAPAPVGPLPVPSPATPEPSVIRSRPVSPFGPEQIFPRPDSVVSRQDVEFRWRPVPRSLFYEVRLATAAGDLVWEGKATATYVRPPGELQLERGQKYFVWVRAYLPEGKAVQSRAVAFTVKGGS